MQYVFVLDKDRKPLDPCHPARARQMLSEGRAAVIRRHPFTIILTDRTQAESVVHEHRVKIDPGSKTTGLALVREGDGKVVWAGEITHRGQVIRDALLSRRAIRRGRRHRHCRYRPARFNNRRRKEGWQPPSLESRLSNVQTWVKRLLRCAVVTAISLELVKFDTQSMQNPEISGVEYQQGELAGYEVREYLLEKWGRKCAYCGKTDTPLEVEHIIPHTRGGTNRVSNLTLACRECNMRKGRQTAAEYGHPNIQSAARLPLKDAAAVNATRWELWRRLAQIGLPVECGTGGRTKYNRVHQGLPKTHWMDAACVGRTGEKVFVPNNLTALGIKSCGHGRRQMCLMDKYGFPRTSAKKSGRIYGFKTGDMVEAKVPKGKYAGVHYGRVVVRASGWFHIGNANMSHRCCRIVQQADHYEYTSKVFAAKNNP